MEYAEARAYIQTGDVLGFSFYGSWFSSLHAFKVNCVRLFTRSEYSHVGIAVRLDGRVFCLESVTGGVRLIPLSKLLPCFILRLDETFDLSRALSVCGEKYSEWEAILGLLDKTRSDNSKWQCAEFVRWAKRLKCPATPSEVINFQLSRGASLIKVVWR